MYQYSQFQPAANKQQPLPAGWEAKYDPTNKQWFFINHTTKTTQWEDPRLTFQQPYAAPTRQQQEKPSPIPQKPQPTTTSFIDPDPKKVASLIADYGIDVSLAKTMLRHNFNVTSNAEAALQKMGFTKKVKPAPYVNADPAKVKILIESYGTSEEQAKAMLRTHSNNLESAGSALKDLGYHKKEADEDIIRHLKIAFPIVPSQVLKSVLIKHNNNEDLAIKALTDMGFKRKMEPKQQLIEKLRNQYPQAPVSAIRNALANTNNSLPGARLSLESSGYKPSRQPSPKPGAAKKSPAKKTATKDDIARANRELKKKFPSLDDSTISLCLKVANNSLEMASRILEAKVEKDKSTTPKRESPAPETSTSITEDVGPRTLAPVVFGSDEPSTSATPSIPSVIVTVDEITKPKKKEEKVKHVERKKQRYTPTKKTYKQAKSNHVGGYKSSLRTEPMGSNSELCKGPDPTLLLSTYAERLGPNKAIRCGPQRSNRCGPDTKNRTGPANLAVGPSANLILV